MAKRLKTSNIATVIYHDKFEYPLTEVELIKWYTPKIVDLNKKVINKNGFYFLSGKSYLIEKRKERERSSSRKMIFAKKAASVLSKIPTVEMIGLTGSLAMKNADKNSDIDFFVITQKATLWTTRIISLALLLLNGIPTRRFGDKNQKDKICLNLWLDEVDLLWKQKNLYTAHEICQIVPLYNKNNAYEKFIVENKWVKGFWPKAVEIKYNLIKKGESSFQLPKFLETISYKMQYFYMKGKITNEKISKTRAVFHPVDRSSLLPLDK